MGVYFEDPPRGFGLDTTGFSEKGPQLFRRFQPLAPACCQAWVAVKELKLRYHNEYT